MSNKSFLHREVKFKGPINGNDLYINRRAFITAYLPDENIFAVIFYNGEWMRFDEDKDIFLNRIEFITKHST